MSVTSIIHFFIISMSNEIVLRKKAKKREEELPVNRRLDVAIGKINLLLNEANGRVSVKDLISMAEQADPSPIGNLTFFCIEFFLILLTNRDD